MIESHVNHGDFSLGSSKGLVEETRNRGDQQGYGKKIGVVIVCYFSRSLEEEPSRSHSNLFGDKFKSVNHFGAKRALGI